MLVRKLDTGGFALEAGGCEGCQGCAQRLFSPLPVPLEFFPRIPSVGQRVNITVESRIIRWAAWVMFGIPLLGLLLGLLLGYSQHFEEHHLVLVAFFSFLVALIFSHILARNADKAVPRVTLEYVLNNETNSLS